MELSKQERHKIYKMAKQSFMDEIIKKLDEELFLGNVYSMCFHIHRAFVIITGKEVRDYQQMCLILTEFDSIRPDNCLYSDYWWLPRDYEIRIEKFNELIEMTK